MPLFPTTRRCFDRRRDERSCSITFGVIAFLLLPLLTLLPTRSSEAQAPVSQGSGYVIELGDAVTTPGQEGLKVEVLVTNADPLTKWEIGLEYDEWWLTLVGIDLNGTVSQNLNPSTTFNDDPSEPAQVQCEYVGAEYSLAPGAKQLVAYLVFDVNPDDTQSLPVGTQKFVDLVFAGEIPALFTLADGHVVQPETDEGLVTIYSGTLVALGNAFGNNVDEILVPVYLWNQSPVESSFAMGLEYDEWWLNFDNIEPMGGLLFDHIATTFVNESVPDQVSLEVTFDSDFDIAPGHQQLLFYLRFWTPDDKLSVATHPLALIGQNTDIDGAPLNHLVSGSITVDGSFVRGDVDFNNALTLIDVTNLLDYMFGDGTVPCLEACNVNGDDSLDIADPVYLLGYMFLFGEPPPPAPFPDPALPMDNVFPCL